MLKTQFALLQYCR